MAENNILPPSEADKYSRWGLGRGVDITNSSPWLEKTSFQVRAVNQDDLIETDHGGLLKAFSEEIRSRTSLNNDVKSGIKAPNTPLTVKMDAEYARSTHSNKYVVGTKIRSRSIAFRVDFVDVPQSRVKTVAEARKQIASSKTVRNPKLKSRQTPSPSSAEDGEEVQSLQVTGLRRGSRSPSPLSKQGDVPKVASVPAAMCLASAQLSALKFEGAQFDELGLFEERLNKWLKDCLPHHGYLPEESLRDMIYKKCSEGDSNFFLQIEQDLDHFVETFGLTHYVSAIELGAMVYNEVGGKEFLEHTNLVTKSAIDSGVYGGVEASASNTISKATKKETVQRKVVGKMEHDRVIEEAVIGCHFTPISALVKMPYLKQALRNSTEKYTKARSRSKGSGLYYITFGDDLKDLHYLTVDHEKFHKLTTTQDITEAELFMVKMFTEFSSHHNFEFSITSTFPKYRERLRQGMEVESDGLSQSDHVLLQGTSCTSMSLSTPYAGDSQKLLPLEYYLETMINAFGKGTRTPRMRINSSSRHVRLLLKNRTNYRIACDTKQWLKGREAYYIQCKHRLHSGYLCAKKVSSNADTPKYKVCVMPSVDSQSDNGQNFMIFRLQPGLQPDLSADIA